MLLMKRQVTYYEHPQSVLKRKTYLKLKNVGSMKSPILHADLQELPNALSRAHVCFREVIHWLHVSGHCWNFC